MHQDLPQESCSRTHRHARADALCGHATCTKHAEVCKQPRDQAYSSRRSNRHIHSRRPTRPTRPTSQPAQTATSCRYQGEANKKSTHRPQRTLKDQGQKQQQQQQPSRPAPPLPITTPKAIRPRTVVAPEHIISHNMVIIVIVMHGIILAFAPWPNYAHVLACAPPQTPLLWILHSMCIQHRHLKHVRTHTHRRNRKSKLASNDGDQLSIAA